MSQEPGPSTSIRTSLIAGAASGSANIGSGFPFDTVKVRLQTTGGHTGAWQCATCIWKTEGVSECSHPFEADTKWDQGTPDEMSSWFIVHSLKYFPRCQPCYGLSHASCCVQGRMWGSSLHRGAQPFSTDTRQ